MTVKEFKAWLEDKGASDEALLLLVHPGGFGSVEMHGYFPKDSGGEEAVVIEGTG